MKKTYLPLWMKLFSSPKKPTRELIERIARALKDNKRVYLHSNGNPIEIGLNQNQEVEIRPIQHPYYKIFD